MTTTTFLAARDTDGFNKWESGQALGTSLIFQVMAGKDMTTTKTWEYVKEAFQRTVEDDAASLDYSILAYALTLPTEGTLTELVDQGVDVDPLAIHDSRGAVKKALALEFQDALQNRYDALTELMATTSADGEFKVDATAIGSRRLRNVCLEYLCSIRSTPEQQTIAAALAKNRSSVSAFTSAFTSTFSSVGGVIGVNDSLLVIVMP